MKTKAKVIFLALGMILSGGSIAVSGSLMSAYAEETVDIQDNQTGCAKNESGETDESQSNSEKDDYGVTPCVDVGRDRGDV